MSDQEICELLKERKIGGMELLFKEYYKPLVVWAATFLHDTQRSEDVVQDFFVKLWEKSFADKLQPDTLKSYLFTSVRNLALNQLDRIDPLRRACDVARYESPWEEYDSFEDEVFRRVETEIGKVPPRTQEIIRSVYLKGMKYKEVADELGISVSTVNSLLVKALKKLRQTTEKEGDIAVYLFFLEKRLLEITGVPYLNSR